VVDGEKEIAGGVFVIPTPGHTPGHQSVRIATSSGQILVAAQAAFTADEYNRGGDPEVQAQEGLETSYLESIARLRSMRAHRIFFSHDEAELGQVPGT
jgi:N-acyl homoserine lactone hydrolase